jgi:acid stress-induced BolA-like protein IbaG/YrbA
MEELINQLRNLLEAEFPEAKVELERASPAEKVGGLLIWSGFDGMEQIERQQRLADVIRSKLSRDDQIRITAILTVTPDERSVPTEG